ncbi:MAG: class I SAM-dependent methyltransferase [Acidobacteriota bacterium]
MAGFNSSPRFTQTGSERVGLRISSDTHTFPKREASAILSSTRHACKVCEGPVRQRHVIKDIPYYHCSTCDFLQVYYWEDHDTKALEQQTANDTRRMERWPAGEPQLMHQKGWQVLQLMYWPLAWYARRFNDVLHAIPGYALFVRWYIKRDQKCLMDFGCGHGVSVLELRKKDKIDIIGLDPFSPTASSYIIPRSLFEEHYPDNSFNGIFSIETIEHITNVLETFSELRRILKPGGVLLIQTSHLEDPRYQAEGERWFYLEDPKTHVSIYSRTAMRRIAAKTGFSSVQFKGFKFAKFTK